MSSDKPSRRELERVLGAELLEALVANIQKSTEFMEALGGQIFNHTLKTWSGVFPADGIITDDYGVAAGAIMVNNVSVTADHNITVSSASPSSSRPTGTGSFVIGPNTCRTVPLASRNFTLYGTAGDIVSYAVLTTAVRASS